MLASAAVSTVAPKYTRSLHNFAETAWCTLGPWGLSPYFFDNCDSRIIGAMNREKDLVVWIIQREAATQIFFKAVVPSAKCPENADWRALSEWRLGSFHKVVRSHHC